MDFGIFTGSIEPYMVLNGNVLAAATASDLQGLNHNIHWQGGDDVLLLSDSDEVSLLRNAGGAVLPAEAVASEAVYLLLDPRAESSLPFLFPVDLVGTDYVVPDWKNIRSFRNDKVKRAEVEAYGDDGFDWSLFYAAPAGGGSPDEVTLDVLNALPTQTYLGIRELTVDRSGYDWTNEIKGQIEVFLDPTLTELPDAGAGDGSPDYSQATIESVFFNDPRAWELGDPGQVLPSPGHWNRFQVNIAPPPNLRFFVEHNAEALYIGLIKFGENVLEFVENVADFGKTIAAAGGSSIDSLMNVGGAIGDAVNSVTGTLTGVFSDVFGFNENTAAPDPEVETPQTALELADPADPPSALDGTVSLADLREAFRTGLSGPDTGVGVQVDLLILSDSLELTVRYEQTFDSFDLSDLEDPSEIDLALGNSLGIDLDFDAAVDLTVTPRLAFALVFGIDLTDATPTDGFYVRLDDLSFTLEAAVENLDLGVDVGFVTAGIDNGTVAMTLVTRMHSSAMNLDDLDDIVSHIQVSVTGGFEADLPLAVGGISGANGDHDFNANGQPRLLIADDDLFDTVLPEFTAENFDDLFDLGGLSWDTLWAALNAIKDALSGPGGPLASDSNSAVNWTIPGINFNLNDHFDAVSALCTLIEAEPETIQEFTQLLIDELGLGSDAVRYVNGDLLIDLEYGVTEGGGVDLTLDLLAWGGTALGPINSLVDSDLAVSLDYYIDALLSLGLTVDFQNGAAVTLRGADTGLAIDFEVAADPINGQFGINGLVEVDVVDGFVVLDGDGDPGTRGATDPVHYGRFTLDFGSGDTAAASVLPGNVQVNLDAALTASLPIHATSLSGATTINGDPIEVSIPDLAAFFTDPSQLTFEFPPDLLNLLDGFSIADNWDDWKLQISLFLDLLQQAFEGEIFGITLPFVGDNLHQAAGFVGDLKTIFDTWAFSEYDAIEADLNAMLGSFLRQGQSVDLLAADDSLIEIVLPLGQTESILFYDPDTVATDPETLSRYDDHRKVATGGLGFDVGIPGLGMELNTPIVFTFEWSLQLHIGFSSEGFFVRTDADAAIGNTPGELQVGVRDFGFATDLLEDATVMEGQLLFLQLTVRDGHAAENYANASRLDGLFTVDLGNSDNDAKLEQNELLQFASHLSVDIEVDAEINLELEVSFPEQDDGGGLATMFPSLRTDFGLGWEWTLLDGSRITHLAFDNLSLNLGRLVTKFISPVVKAVNDILDPIRPLVDFLSTRLPVFSDIPNLRDFEVQGRRLDFDGDGEVEILELIPLGPNQRVFLSTVDRIAELADQLTPLTAIDENQYIVLGGFNLNHLDAGASDFDLSAVSLEDLDLSGFLDYEGLLAEILDTADNLLDEAARLVEDLEAFLRELDFIGDELDRQKPVIEFPLLKNPTHAVSLLLGQPIILFEVDLPKFTLDWSIDQEIPIFPLLPIVFIEFSGGFGVEFNLDFGYDTRGYTDFHDNDFKNPLLLLNGFYLSDHSDGDEDEPEIVLSADVAAGVGVGLPFIANVSGEGFAEATIDFNLNDTDGDGRFRGSEFVDLFPKCLFDIQGVFTIGLQIEVTVAGKSDGWDIATRDFEFLNHGCPPAVPGALARVEQQGALNVLVLNSGESGAAARGEPITGVTDFFDWLNEYWTIQNVGGVRGDEEIRVTFRSTSETYTGIDRIEADLEAGDDTLFIWPGVPATVEATGGDGADTMIAGDGPAIFNGNAGNDILIGGPFDDELRGGDDDDTLYGYGGDDDLFGGKHADTLYGHEGDDTLKGNAGNDVLKGGDGDDRIWGEGDDDSVVGGPGSDYLHGGPGEDFIYAPATDAIRVHHRSSEVELRSNLLWARAGYTVFIDDDSRAGYFADHNFLHNTGQAGLLYHFVRDYVDLIDLQSDLLHLETHSLNRGVSPLAMAPRFLSIGRDEYTLSPLANGFRFTNPMVNAADPLQDLLTPPDLVNLLENPGFEDPGTMDTVPGWTTAELNLARAPGAAFLGDAGLRAGSGSTANAVQTIDLIELGFATADLDSGAFDVEFGGRIRVGDEVLKDQGRITVVFEDVGHAEIDRVTVEAFRHADRWERVGARVALAPGTRFIRYEFDAERTSGPTTDVVFDEAFVFLADSGDIPNLGAYSGSKLEAPNFDLPYLQLTEPVFYTDWEVGTTRTIRWNSFHNDGGQVQIDVFQDTGNGPEFLAAIALTEDDGEFDWAPNDSSISPDTSDLYIFITPSGDPHRFDFSSESFTVPPLGDIYYVNEFNDADLADNVFTTAAGSNRNTGKSMDDPKPSIAAVLAAYELDSTDQIRVDVGAYRHVDAIRISPHTDYGRGLDDQFIIAGPTTGTATISLKIPGDNVPLFFLDKSMATEMRDLDLIAGSTAIEIVNQSVDVILRNLAISRTSETGPSDLDTGIAIRRAESVRVRDGSIHGFDHGVGIRIDGLTGAGSRVDLENTTIRDNRRGVQAILGNGESMTVSGGTFANHSDTALWGDGAGSIRVVDARLHDNTTGMRTTTITDLEHVQFEQNQLGLEHQSARDLRLQDGLVIGNGVGLELHGGARVFNQRFDGNGIGIAIEPRLNSPSTLEIRGNVFHRNGVGIDLMGRTVPLEIEIGQNLFTEHTRASVAARGGGVRSFSLLNNTLYEPLANGVYLPGGMAAVELRNNIIWTLSGMGLVVDSSSQAGLISDDNLLFATNTGSVGFWAGPHTTLVAWQAASGQDGDSLSANPLFVDIPGRNFHLSSVRGSLKPGIGFRVPSFTTPSWTGTTPPPAHTGSN